MAGDALPERKVAQARAGNIQRARSGGAMCAKATLGFPKFGQFQAGLTEVKPGRGADV
jgi:hypothetical protein